MILLDPCSPEVPVRRALAWLSLGLLVLCSGGLAGAGWYYSDQVLPAPAPYQPALDLTVAAVDPDASTVTLTGDHPDLDLHTVGIVAEDLLLVANGAPVDAPRGVTRTATPVTGEWPTPGAAVGLSVDTFRGDPASTLGLPFDNVTVTSPLGDLPAWRVVPRGAATDRTWVVIIHGRGGTLSEGNRLLPALDDLGLPSLTISVRNDPDAPADPQGFGYFGSREWEELAAAIDHLIRVEGAREVVLAGYSQGASVALSLLRHSEHAELVTAAVLVSPLVSLEATLEHQARGRGIPDPLIAPLVAATRWICALRAGLDFAEVEHGAAIEQLPDHVSFLLTHGSGDSAIPVEPTRALAAALGDRAIYVEYNGVEHVREWNADAAAFESDLRQWLTQATNR